MLSFLFVEKGSFSSRNRPSRNSTLFSSRRSPWSVLKCNQVSEETHKGLFNPLWVSDITQISYCKMIFKSFCFSFVFACQKTNSVSILKYFSRSANCVCYSKTQTILFVLCLRKEAINQLSTSLRNKRFHFGFLARGHIAYVQTSPISFVAGVKRMSA